VRPALRLQIHSDISAAEWNPPFTEAGAPLRLDQLACLRPRRPVSATASSRYTRYVLWRQRIAVLLLVALAALPVSGTVCALACESAAGAVVSHHSAGEACDEPAPPLQGGPQISGPPEHDCNTHDGLVRQPTLAPADRMNRTASSAPAVLAAVPFESGALPVSSPPLDHSSPPGTAPVTTTPLVLRV
jgi:hypothetical protein